MTKAIDRLMSELKWLDPLSRDEIDGALESAEARELRSWITSLEVEPARPPREVDGGSQEPGVGSGWRRRAIPVVGLAALAIAAALQVLLGGVPGGGRQGRLGEVLDRAAAVTAATYGPRTQTVAAHQYAYRKTREVSLDTTRRGRRSWSVYQRSTREEWVAWDGSGLLRIDSEPTRFAAPGDRAEWSAAGRPNFLPLGFAGRTEDHWVAAGMLDRNFEQLPTGPAALAARLEKQAKARQAGNSVAAGTLGEIAEDLREPGASSELRQALYEAAKLVPGIEYLGARTDPEGRRGIAVGVRGSYAGRPARFSMIFDPDTAAVLATETTALKRGAGRGAPGRLLRARVYLEARGCRSAGASRGHLTGQVRDGLRPAAVDSLPDLWHPGPEPVVASNRRVLQTEEEQRMSETTELLVEGDAATSADDRPGGGPAKPQPTLGRRLKALRTSRGMSLKEVAAGTGVSASFLSMIEMGRNEMSVGRLVTMAEFYEVALGDLIPERDSEQPVILRHDERRSIDSHDHRVRAEMLASWHHGDMTSRFIRFEVGGESREAANQAGPEFALVLSGELKIEFSDDTSVVLAEGDSIWFEGSRSHRLLNAGNGELCIVTFKGVMRSGQL